jgi:hypothetical protein
MTKPRKGRRSDRLAVNSYAAIQVSGLLPNDQAFGKVINVSQGGILVRTPQAPPIGQHAIVRAAKGEEVFAMNALVVRVAEVGPHCYDVALQFLSKESEQHRFIQAFLVRA